jgi:hypothetical protein
MQIHTVFLCFCYIWAAGFSLLEISVVADRAKIQSAVSIDVAQLDMILVGTVRDALVL